MYSTDQINSPPKCKDLKETSDIDMELEIENECTFIKMNSFSNSPPATSSVAARDAEVALLNKPKSNLTNIKTYDPECEACVIASDSSNDSCKILQHTTFSEFKTSPIKSFERTVNKNQVSPEIALENRATTSYVSLQSPPKIYLDQSLQEKGVFSDFSFEHSKNALNNSWNTDHEKLISSKSGDNSNEDIFIIKECSDKSNNIHKTDSLSLAKTLPIETSYDSSHKLSSFSSMFQKDYEDLNAAICPSQNMSFQNQSINRLDNSTSKLCEEGPVSFNASPMKLNFNENYSKPQFDSNISPIKSNSFHNESRNSNEIDCFDYNDYEMNNVTSPEILVCDSGDENTEQVLGSGYFRNSETVSQTTSSPTINELRKSFLNAVENESTPDGKFSGNSNINWTDKTEFQSQSKENDDVFSHSFCDTSKYKKCSVLIGEESTSFLKRSPKKSSPELICCDSNSDDKLEVIEYFTSSYSNRKNVSQHAEDDCIHVLQDSKNNKQETVKTSPYVSF